MAEVAATTQLHSLTEVGLAVGVTVGLVALALWLLHKESKRER